MTDTTVFILIGIAGLFLPGIGSLILDAVKASLGFAKKTDSINNKQEIELAILNERVDKIMTNHLPHLQASLTEHNADERKMWKLIVMIATKLEIDTTNY